MFIRNISNCALVQISALMAWWFLLLVISSFDYHTEYIYLFYSLTMGFGLAIFMVSLDGIIKRIVKFVTDGDKDWNKEIGKYVFGKQYINAGNAHEQFILWGGNITLYLSIITISILYPQSLIVTVPIVVVISSVWGLLLLTRKVYRVNKTLANHVNDTEVHKSSNGDKDLGTLSYNKKVA